MSAINTFVMLSFSLILSSAFAQEETKAVKQCRYDSYVARGEISAAIAPKMEATRARAEAMSAALVKTLEKGKGKAAVSAGRYHQIFNSNPDEPQKGGKIEKLYPRGDWMDKWQSDYQTQLQKVMKEAPMSKLVRDAEAKGEKVYVVVNYQSYDRQRKGTLSAPGVDVCIESAAKLKEKWHGKSVEVTGAMHCSQYLYEGNRFDQGNGDFLHGDWRINGLDKKKFDQTHVASCKSIKESPYLWKEDFERGTEPARKGARSKK